MQTLLSSTQAHTIADQAQAEMFKQFIVDQHAAIKRDARNGKYTKTIVLPQQYVSKSLEVLQYFHLFGYAVAVNKAVITLTW